MDRQYCGQAIQVKAPVRITGLHFRLQCPADVFYLTIPGLKTIDEFDAPRVDIALLSGGVKEVRVDAQDQRRVFLS
jgi:hypothetical protein